MNTSTTPKKSKTSVKPLKQQQLQTKDMAMKMSKARGFLKGIDTTIIREPDREF